jgi:hypothetical protein
MSEAQALLCRLRMIKCGGRVFLSRRISAVWKPGKEDLQGLQEGGIPVYEKDEQGPHDFLDAFSNIQKNCPEKLHRDVRQTEDRRDRVAQNIGGKVPHKSPKCLFMINGHAQLPAV